MKAALISREKFFYEDGAMREMILWKLRERSSVRPHGLKYRLYYGLADGTCIVRYDNEAAKGDHRHVRGKEEPYEFRSVEALVADFLSDIERARSRS